MAITFSNLGSSANPDINDNTDLNTYSNSSWTPPSSGLIVVFVSSRATSGSTNLPSISGNSLTWTQIATVNFANAHTMTLFGANASGSTTGVTTITFGGQTQQACRASFFLAEGVDLSGGVAAAFVQSPTGSGSGADNGSVTLSAASDSNNRPIAGFGHSANEGKTPRANWTELDDLTGGFGGTMVETQYRSDTFETTASATWVTSSAITWLGIAAELKASGGAAPGTVHPVFSDDNIHDVMFGGQVVR